VRKCRQQKGATDRREAQHRSVENGRGRKILLSPLWGALRGDVGAGDQSRQFTRVRGLPHRHAIARRGPSAVAVSADPAARGSVRLLSRRRHPIVTANSSVQRDPAWRRFAAALFSDGQGATLSLNRSLRVALSPHFLPLFRQDLSPIRKPPRAFAKHIDGPETSRASAMKIVHTNYATGAILSIMYANSATHPRITNAPREPKWP
jgi:hypothetical protein